MKILQITDIEGYTPTIPDDILDGLDCVVVSGDISIGAKRIARNAKHFQYIRNAIPSEIPIYYIPGNREYENVVNGFEGLPDNMHPLHDKIVKFTAKDGKTIFFVGFGGALPGLLNNFAKTEEENLEAFERLFKDLKDMMNDGDYTMIVSHNPPKNTGLDDAKFGGHVGSQSLLDIIQKYSPDVCVCGHIHESPGIENIADTICINPGASKHGKAGLIVITDEIKVEIVEIEAKR